MSTVIKVIVWFICLILSTDAGLTLINETSTIANIVGVAVIVTVVAISIKTKCLTTIKFKNNEK